MTTVIPEHKRVTCDFCGATNDDRSKFKTEARVLINRSALDHLGSAVGPGHSNFDACDDCIIGIERMLKDFHPTP